MNVQIAHSLRISRTIHADREAVWEAWTRPEHMKKWACPAPGGVQDVRTDFRVGGDYTLTMVVDGTVYTAFGTYREIEAPRRLVYTWDWKEEDHRVGETLVTVEFEERDEGTEVTLTHEGFGAAEPKESHEEGWGACLTHLETMFV